MSKKLAKNNVFNEVHSRMDLKQQLMYICVVVAIIVLLAGYIMNKVIKKNKFTCEGYVLNTYIYICLSFLLIAFLNLLLEYKKYKFNINPMLYWGLIILMFISIFALHFVSTKYLGLKHIIWLAFILSTAFLFHPLYIVSKYTKTYISALLTTALLVILITATVFIRPDMVSLKMGPVLFWLLLIGIIMEIISRFVVKEKTDLMYKAFCYFFIIIFTGYLLYDTRVLQENAKKCVESVGADYIKESLGMFLDMFNILIRIMSLKARE